jgi:hypothetical protein
MEKWAEGFVCSKQLGVNEDSACKKTINFTNITRLRDIEKYLFKITCTWEKYVRRAQPSFEVMGKRKYETRKRLEITVKAATLVV